MRARETRAEPELRKTKTAMGSLIWRFAALHASLIAVIDSSILFSRAFPCKHCLFTTVWFRT